jgi:hypothetical protein
LGVELLRRDWRRHVRLDMGLWLGDLSYSGVAFALDQVLGNRAADHRPKGKVDFDSNYHLAFPNFLI